MSEAPGPGKNPPQHIDEVVRCEIHDGMAVWTLDRPSRSNALTKAMVTRLRELCQQAERSRSVRAVLIVGQGDRAFCAGADLQERRTMSEAQVLELLSDFRSTFTAIDRLSKPTVAVLNGAALGGGLELALACDLRIAAPSTTLGLVETQLGIIPGAGGTQRLAKTVGPARAKEMILLARRIDANEALRIGLVHAVAPSDAPVLRYAQQWCAPLARGASVALAAALEAVDAASDRSLEEGLDVERACYERTLGTRDRLEALEAFRERRKPEFLGE